MSDDQTTQIREAIQSAISENPVILFMKGTPDQPMCGFSARRRWRSSSPSARRSRR